MFFGFGVEGGEEDEEGTCHEVGLPAFSGARRAIVGIGVGAGDYALNIGEHVADAMVIGFTVVAYGFFQPVDAQMFAKHTWELARLFHLR